MRQAMATAPVGDDVYGEDPTIIALEARVAELLGHEAGLFCPTGSMANLLGVWSLVPARTRGAVRSAGPHRPCRDGRARRTPRRDHAYLDVHFRHARHRTDQRHHRPAGARLRPLPGGDRRVEVENTHNFGGGTVQPIEALREIREICRQGGVAMHLDGARLWNAHVATGVPLGEYGSLFDTVSVCLSKGLGAPVGSVLVVERTTNRASPRTAQASGRRHGGRPASWRPLRCTPWTTTSTGSPTTTPTPGCSPSRSRPRYRQRSISSIWRPTSW